MLRENIHFSTSLAVPPLPFELDHASKILLMGSCFAENMGQFLQSYKFCVEQNPFGILYNPFSVSQSLKRLMNPIPFTETDLICSQSVYHSWDHHSRFSGMSPEECLDGINKQLVRTAAFFEKTDTILITWGTAFVYFLKENNRIVANCHKQAESLFVRRRLDVEEIVEEWVSCMDEILGRNPHIRFIFTVSPIRHWKDGAHGNQLSKSILLLAIDRLCTHFPKNTAYFPSYEIMMDELRDYRFYAEDMLHPSQLAIRYIWKRFQEAAFSAKTIRLMESVEQIQKALNHKPFHPKSASHYRFLEQTLQKIDTVSSTAGIDFYEEKKRLLQLLDANIKNKEN